MTVVAGRIGSVGDPVGGPEARRAARDELSRAEYRTSGPGLVDRFLRWLGRLLGGDGPDGTAAFGGRALVIFGLLLLAVLVVVAVRAGLPRRTPRTTLEQDDPLAPVAAGEHQRRAGDYATGGQWALALREYLRAAIATVEERGVLPPRPGRTGAATAREAGPLLPTAAGALAAATAAFDEVWFGGRAATAQDCALGRAADAAVVQARIAGAAAQAPAPAGLAVPQ